MQPRSESTILHKVLLMKINSFGISISHFNNIKILHHSCPVIHLHIQSYTKKKKKHLWSITLLGETKCARVQHFILKATVETIRVRIYLELWIVWGAKDRNQIPRIYNMINGVALIHFSQTRPLLPCIRTFMWPDDQLSKAWP